MSGAAVVEIGSGDVVECSRRILLAFQSSSLQALDRELTRAARVCRHAAAPGTPGSSLAKEQADLLAAIVDSMRAPASGHRLYADTEISLLVHMARSESPRQ